MVNKDEHIKHIGLYTKILANEASATETEQFHSLISHAQSRAEFEQYKKTWDSIAIKKLHNTIDINSEWNAFTEKRRKQQKKPIAINFRRYALPLAAALILGVAVFSLLKNKQSIKTTTIASLSQVEQLVLPDSSVVYLAPNSSIVYTGSFNEQHRNLSLTGEAFFEVQPNKLLPFNITTTNARVTVLGTSFNVNAHSSGNTEVIVNTGKVQLSNSTDTKSIELLPGEKGLLIRDNNELLKSINTKPNYNSWKTHIFTYNNTKLSQVVNDLNKAYGSHIVIKNIALEKCKITTRFEQQSLSAVLEVLESILNIEITTTQHSIIIDGKGCSG